MSSFIDQHLSAKDVYYRANDVVDAFGKMDCKTLDLLPYDLATALIELRTSITKFKRLLKESPDVNAK